jgi:hypothetical protein
VLHITQRRDDHTSQQLVQDISRLLVPNFSVIWRRTFFSSAMDM